MKKVYDYLKPVLQSKPHSGFGSALLEFKDFWNACSEAEQAEYVAGLPA